MQISRPDEKTVLLSHLDTLLAELLRRISPSAEPGDSAAARARLYSAPTHDKEEAEFAEDWREFVEPGLAHIFKSSLEVIDGDLRNLEIDKKSGETSIVIKVAHLESWIHGLNQARLSLCARFDFTEEEMDNLLPLDGTPRTLALLQIRVYAVLQEWFLRVLEGD